MNGFGWNAMAMNGIYLSALVRCEPNYRQQLIVITHFKIKSYRFTACCPRFHAFFFCRCFGLFTDNRFSSTEYGIVGMLAGKKKIYENERWKSLTVFILEFISAIGHKYATEWIWLRRYIWIHSKDEDTFQLNDHQFQNSSFFNISTMMGSVHIGSPILRQLAPCNIHTYTNTIQL